MSTAATTIPSMPPLDPKIEYLVDEARSDLKKLANFSGWPLESASERDFELVESNNGAEEVPMMNDEEKLAWLVEEAKADIARTTAQLSEEAHNAARNMSQKLSKAPALLSSSMQLPSSFTARSSGAPAPSLAAAAMADGRDVDRRRPNGPPNGGASRSVQPPPSEGDKLTWLMEEAKADFARTASSFSQFSSKSFSVAESKDYSRDAAAVIKGVTSKESAETKEAATSIAGVADSQAESQPAAPQKNQEKQEKDPFDVNRLVTEAMADLQRLASSILASFSIFGSSDKSTEVDEEDAAAGWEGVSPEEAEKKPPVETGETKVMKAYIQHKWSSSSGSSSTNDQEPEEVSTKTEASASTDPTSPSVPDDEATADERGGHQRAPPVDPPAQEPREKKKEEPREIVETESDIRAAQVADAIMERQQQDSDDDFVAVVSVSSEEVEEEDEEEEKEQPVVAASEASSERKASGEFVAVEKEDTQNESDDDWETMSDDLDKKTTEEQEMPNVKIEGYIPRATPGDVDKMLERIRSRVERPSLSAEEQVNELIASARKSCNMSVSVKSVKK